MPKMLLNPRGLMKTLILFSILSLSFSAFAAGPTASNTFPVPCDLEEKENSVDVVAYSFNEYGNIKKNILATYAGNHALSNAGIELQDLRKIGLCKLIQQINY